MSETAVDADPRSTAKKASGSGAAVRAAGALRATSPARGSGVEARLLVHLLETLDEALDPRVVGEDALHLGEVTPEEAA